MKAPKALWLALLAVAVCLPPPASASLLDDFEHAAKAAANAVKNVTRGVAQIFHYGGDSNYVPAAVGPLTAKTARAMAYALSGSQPAVDGAPVTVAPLPNGASVAVHQAGLNQIILSFQAGPASQAGGSSGQAPPANVTFLQNFVYTSTAPAVLVQTFAPLHQGANTSGPLTQTIAAMMGGRPVLHVICTGEGDGGGGLAALCGPWAALAFPTANVDVISFGGPDWGSSFNTQFSWSFFRLVTLFYLWPFSSANVTNAQALKADLANLTPAVDKLITSQAVQQAINLPNLPPNLPPGVPAQDYLGPDLGPLAPAPPEQEPPASPCPLILCKTREVVRSACFVFSNNATRNSSALPQGLPSLRLPSSGSDCVVAWDAPTQTAFFFWQGTESRLDWAQDFLVFTSDDFRPAAQLGAVFPGVKVHRGFLNEFNRQAAPARAAPGQLNLTSALYQLNDGVAPRIVVASGHSLGAGLSALTGVWASSLWPNASVMVTSTGQPLVGDRDWEALYRATVGQDYRYVFRVDQVPDLPPTALGYVQLPGGMWVRNVTGPILLQDRPRYSLTETTWDDHNCADLYVPTILAATAVVVPQWIYTATPEVAAAAG